MPRISSAGKRKHDDPRNELFKSYLKLVKALQPRAVLIKNIHGFTVDFDNGKHRPSLCAEAPGPPL